MPKPSENKVLHNDQVTGPVGKWDPAKNCVSVQHEFYVCSM